MSDWVKVWLVREETRSPGFFEVMEAEAQPIYESGEWKVDVRNGTCRSRMIYVLPDEKVYKTREEAERRKQQLEGGEA